MSEEKKELSIVMRANNELNTQLSDPSVFRALIATTFKGFRDEKIVKQACLEAMIRGYSFQDILRKKIYAIPFGNGYSLVQSISDVRAIAMKSGQIGKKEPVFEERKGKVYSCTVTVQRLVSGHIGDYTATVFFEEYNKGKDNWLHKPRTMIAKVAEMHALRMAFPEELAQSYVEEEFDSAESSKDSDIEDRMKKATEESESLKLGNFEKKVEEPVETQKEEDGKRGIVHEAGCGVEKGEQCTCIPVVNS